MNLPSIGNMKDDGNGIFTNQVVKNINFSWSYYKMINAKGREVPIADHNLQWALKHMFRHTDGVLYTDSPKDAVIATPKNAQEQMAASADAMLQLAKSIVPATPSTVPATVFTKEQLEEDEATPYDEFTSADLKEQIKAKGGTVKGNPSRATLIKNLEGLETPIANE